MRKTILTLWMATAAFASPILLTTTTNQLITIDNATPGTVQSSVAISGLVAGDEVRGIDFRPATNQLFLLGTTTLYTVNTNSGVLTAVGASNQFTLNGTLFGFDFNPTVDRIRVTSDTGQNLRLNPITGGLAVADSNLNGAATGLVASAYTNNFAGAATTLLYGIGSGNLYTQNPPNNGTLNLVGSLGVPGIVGMDIRPDGMAFAVNSNSLYTVNLTTGAASLVGQIGSGTLGVTGLAAPTPIPEPGSFLLLSLGLAALTAVRSRRR